MIPSASFRLKHTNDTLSRLPPGHAMTWPEARHVLGPARMKRAFHRYKYALLLLLTARQRARLLRLLDTYPEWRQLFVATPSNFFVLFRRYLDRRHSMWQRFDSLMVDLTVAADKFGTDTMRLLAAGHGVRVGAQPGFSVDLTINRPTRIEGFWAFSLNDADNRPLFNLSFGFTGPDSVLIASVQGIKRHDDSAPGVIRSLTKGAHGLRPHFMLLEVFKMACASWGIQHIRGIDSAHQVTRYKKQDDEFKFDYRAFWREHGAVQQPDGAWLLPNQTRRRTPDEMPAHKRAMYRRRYALLDALAALVAAGLQAPAAAPEPLLG